MSTPWLTSVMNWMNLWRTSSLSGVYSRDVLIDPASLQREQCESERKEEKWRAGPAAERQVVQPRSCNEEEEEGLLSGRWSAHSRSLILQSTKGISSHRTQTISAYGEDCKQLSPPILTWCFHCCKANRSSGVKKRYTKRHTNINSLKSIECADLDGICWVSVSTKLFKKKLAMLLV